MQTYNSYPNGHTFPEAVSNNSWLVQEKLTSLNNYKVSLQADAERKPHLRDHLLSELDRVEGKIMDLEEILTA